MGSVADIPVAGSSRNDTRADQIPPEDRAAFPLTGISVVDATSDFAGRMCARLLADAGATVVRFDSVSDVSDWSSFVGQGLDVSPAGVNWQAAFATAHVVLCSGRLPEAHAVTGADAIRPNQIVVRFPAFGKGPYEPLEGGDVVLSALSGLADCTPGYPDWQEGPVQPPIQSSARLAEFGAALTCAIATVGALVGRLRGVSTPGDIEVTQFEAAVALMVFDWGPAAYVGDAPGRRRNGRLLEPNCFIKCKDGYVVIVATNDNQWRSLARAMGSPQWSSDSRFDTILGRAEHKDDLHHLIATWALENSGRDLAAAAQEAGVPCAFVLTLTEAIESEQVDAVASLERVGERLLPADAIVLNGTRRPRYSQRPASDDPSWFATERRISAQPLVGIRVLDLSQLIAGPLAGQYLASLGAEVFILESRRHPTPRMYGPFVGVPQHDASSNFNHANRGKKSVELDLKTAEGKRLFARLVRQSDVVLENFSRRAALELGITYGALTYERPDIVFASISAFGRTGPWGAYTANHAGVAALSGLASVTLGLKGEPHLAGAIMPDVLTGAYTALAIVEALAGRELTGRGAHIEVSMLDVVLNTIGGLVPAASAHGRISREQPARFYEVAGGDAKHYIAVATPHDPAAVDDVIRSVSPEQAVTALQKAGFRAAPVQNMLSVLDDPHLNARGFVQRVDHPVAGMRLAPAVPWTFDGVRPPLGAAPVLGSDTRAAMSDLLGMSSAEYERLRDGGVLR